MYNHRMGPVRQAVALHSVTQVMEDGKYKFTVELNARENLNLAVRELYLNSTNNNAHFKLNGMFNWSTQPEHKRLLHV